MAGKKIICLIFIISKVFRIAIKAFWKQDIRSKTECLASGDKTNLVTIKDTVIEMDWKSRSLFLGSNHC